MRAIALVANNPSGSTKSNIVSFGLKYVPCNMKGLEVLARFGSEYYIVPLLSQQSNNRTYLLAGKWYVRNKILTIKCGGGGGLREGGGITMPMLTFDRGDLRGISYPKTQKIETRQKFQFAVQKKLLPENTLFDVPPPTLGTLAHRTHVEIC